MELFRVEFGSFRVNGRSSMCREAHSLGLGREVGVCNGTFQG